MKPATAVRVRRLIEEFALHDLGAPVDLRPVHNVYVPHVSDLEALAGIPAFAIRPPDLVATSDRPALIYLDARLDVPETRLNYAHEVGHVLCGHAGSLPHLDLGEWWYDRDEREAWQVASRLLIPWSVLVSGYTVSDIAMICEVPEWLVEMYPR